MVGAKILQDLLYVGAPAYFYFNSSASRVMLVKGRIMPSDYAPTVTKLQKHGPKSRQVSLCQHGERLMIVFFLSHGLLDRRVSWDLK